MKAGMNMQEGMKKLRGNTAVKSSAWSKEFVNIMGQRGIQCGEDEREEYFASFDLVGGPEGDVFRF